MGMQAIASVSRLNGFDALVEAHAFTGSREVAKLVKPFFSLDRREDKIPGRKARRRILGTARITRDRSARTSSLWEKEQTHAPILGNVTWCSTAFAVGG